MSDSNFQRDESEGTWIRLLPLPARWMSESANAVFDNATIMLLLEGIFEIGTQPNFEFYMLDLR